MARIYCAIKFVLRLIKHECVLHVRGVHTYNSRACLYTLYSAFGKVFIPLDFFHILLHYLIFKCIQYFLFLTNLHTIPQNDKANLFGVHLW